MHNVLIFINKNITGVLSAILFIFRYLQNFGFYRIVRGDFFSVILRFHQVYKYKIAKQLSYNNIIDEFEQETKKKSSVIFKV